MMTDRVEGRTARVALVTGCGKPRGIGGASARMLAARGLTVVAADILPAGVPDAIVPEGAPQGGIDLLAEAIVAAGGVCTTTMGDVSDPSDAQRMVDEVVERYGRLDVLVNAAGAPQGPEFADVAEVPLQAWHDVLRINLTGTFLMSQAAVPAMRANRWGRIVNLSSLAGITGYRRQAAYSASKAGVLGLTRSMALDVARDGITVNAICPGWIHTDRTYSSVRRVDEDVERELERRRGIVPVGRLGTGEDVAATIAFLCSDEASFVTGQHHIVDGGQLTL
jgi:3-oxoacyl-[acyl-carrier protein] reductase